MYALSVAIAALFNIALNFLLIPDFGAMGCAIAMVVTEYVVLSVQLVAIRGRVPVVIFLKKAAFALPVGVIMFCAIKYFLARLSLLGSIQLSGYLWNAWEALRFT